MSATRPLWWYVCDKGVCLYSQRGIDSLLNRSHGDPRCIKHGALLMPDWLLDGLSEREARAQHRAVLAKVAP
jgi:hypothetical protein